MIIEKMRKLRNIWILCLLLAVGQSSFSHSPATSLSQILNYSISEAPKDTTERKKPRYTVRRTTVEEEIKTWIDGQTSCDGRSV